MPWGKGPEKQEADLEGQVAQDKGGPDMVQVWSSTAKSGLDSWLHWTSDLTSESLIFLSCKMGIYTTCICLRIKGESC